MRTLKFKVSRQTIKQDPDCDFSGIVAGTSGYLQAQFEFDKDWDKTVKAAEFCRYASEDQAVAAVIKNNTCMIPPEVLACSRWSVRVFGKRGDFRIVTGKITVTQEV